MKNIFRITRRLQSTNAAARMYQLIGGELSPYTAKVRFYLRYKNIPFESVTASAEIYSQFIKPRVGWNVIPVLVTSQNNVIQDSSDIIEFLEKRHPDPSIEPTTAKHKLISALIELFADEWLVLPIMHYRWSFPENLQFLKEEFGRIAFPEYSTSQRLEVAEMLYTKFKSMRDILGINENTGPAIEQSLKELLDELTVHFDKYPYLLGGKPCIADFALAGMFYAHLFRDPVSGFVMKTRAPLVAAWCEQMNGHLPEISKYNVHEVTKNGRIVKKQQPTGADNFCSNDEIPETLYPILKRFCSEFGPVLMSTRIKLIEHIQKNVREGSTKLPRNLGTHDYHLGTASAPRGIFPFNVWMWQRVTDIYNAMDIEDKKQSEQLLSKFPHGCEIIQANLNQCRVERKNNFLHAVLPRNKL
uniref:GST N-terminal domain-containing protein n=1 Tax=Ciona savignyi TaxID=51511 RepID=H2YGG9_CIOSA